MKRKIDKSELITVFNDTLQQFDFDIHVVKAAIDDQILRALKYIEPKIVDAVVKARVAEVAAGIKENLIVSQLKKGVDLFVNISHTFDIRKFDYLHKDFPYDNKTRQIAAKELERIQELHETAEQEVKLGTRSKYHYINRAIHNLEIFIKGLPKVELATVNVSAAGAALPVNAAAAVSLKNDSGNIDKLHDDETILSLDLDHAPILNLDDGPVLELDDDAAPLLAVNANKPVKPAALTGQLQSNVETLDLACIAYKTHLLNQINEIREKDEPGSKYDNHDLYQKIQPIANASEMLELTRKKFNAVHAMHKQLLVTDKSASEKLVAFRAEYTDKRKDILNTRRDSKGITFLKVVATIFTFALSIAFGLWTPKGRQLGKQIERLTPLPPAMPGG
jgi:hypothetical protein